MASYCLELLEAELAAKLAAGKILRSGPHDTPALCAAACSGSGGSGSGSSGSGGSGGGGGGYPPGGGPTCLTAAGMTVGVTYGPYTLRFPNLDWFQFLALAGQDYHVTLTYIGGDGNAMGGNYYAGPCSGLTYLISPVVVNSIDPVICTPIAAGGGYTAYLMISSGGVGDFTLRVDTGPCP